MMVIKILIYFLTITLNSYSSILITVPHARCVPINERTCDSMATRAAEFLHNNLADSTAFLSTHYREDTDLNREEARGTSYRTQLSTLLQECRKSRLNCLLVDVHSFPPESYNIEERKYSKIPDLYFLQAFYDNQLSNYLYTYLSKNKIFSEVLQGSYKNDILLEASFYHIPSVIIEFNESLSSERLQQITTILSQGILNYVKGVDQPFKKPGYFELFKKQFFNIQYGILVFLICTLSLFLLFYKIIKTWKR